MTLEKLKNQLKELEERFERLDKQDPYKAKRAKYDNLATVFYGENSQYNHWGIAFQSTEESIKNVKQLILALEDNSKYWEDLIEKEKQSNDHRMQSQIDFQKYRNKELSNLLKERDEVILAQSEKITKLANALADTQLLLVKKNES